MKKVLVVGHERAGNSFLMNSIAGNFPNYLPEFNEVGESQRVDLDGAGINFADPDEMRTFLSDTRFHDLPIRNIFKSHHSMDFFKPVWDYLTEQFCVFLITRDGRDVLTSYWRHTRKQGFLWNAMTFTVGEFLRAEPVGAACRYHGKNVPRNMVQRWNDHIILWMSPLLKDVCYVSYEELSENFDRTVARIGSYLEMELPETIRRPKVAGVHPGKGIVGDWKNHLSPDDEAFFVAHARPAMKILKMETELI